MYKYEIMKMKKEYKTKLCRCQDARMCIQVFNGFCIKKHLVTGCSSGIVLTRFMQQQQHIWAKEEVAIWGSFCNHWEAPVCSWPNCKYCNSDKRLSNICCSNYAGAYLINCSCIKIGFQTAKWKGLICSWPNCQCWYIETEDVLRQLYSSITFDQQQ